METRMRAVLVALILFAGVFLAPPASASMAETDLQVLGDCAAPPCGPIPVIITILLEKSKGLTFTDNRFETTGTLQYYFDIDQNGYAYDPAKDMKITLKINKQPPWVKTSVEPTEMDVPLQTWECPQCIKQEGSDPQQQMFYWEAPVKVTVEKLRDPTAEELKKWTKSDGTYRASFSAVSNDSMVGTDQSGRPAGLMEGYGIKELRFLASAETAAASGVVPEGEAPGAGFAGVFGVILAALVIAVRRRDE